MFEPPTNLAQIQKQFACWIFNSIFLNLNLLPKGKLFIMIQATLIQNLERFRAREGSFEYFTNRSKFENLKTVCVADWARPGETVAWVGFKPIAPTRESNQRRGALTVLCPSQFS
jgi:hypothetical protein